MSQDCLIAEIAADNLRYVVVKLDENSNHKILSKKVFQNNGIEKGKIIDFEHTAKKINQDIKDL